ncbi:hypothetical protein L228DRAFT_264853 [Xylona heveae TC161]|uniref:Uncharacterized protein n=1 Tax=Xylona heveae (strain CBS 132557 / TC161) TaxID=1328760 RepID=A0A165JNM4_XYLHT|nr:hypothetical protein L228DRAFT_264853 [Xylona heveae TC161]KZF26458.1 hypothetical protein L228DRAFT_264853 [Xylona heveae TC161]
MPGDQPVNQPLVSPAKYPVALYPEYITSSPTMIIIKQHNLRRDFTCFHANSNVLFHVAGKNLSQRRRRTFIDPTKDTSLFELRRRYFNINEHWYLEFPTSAGASDNDGISSFCSVAIVWKGWANFNVTFNNMAAPGSAKGERTVLEVRALTFRRLLYCVYLDGAKILDLRKIPSPEAPERTPRPGKKPRRTGYCAWEVDIASGVDLSLASVITVITAELNKSDIWSRRNHV